MSGWVYVYYEIEGADGEKQYSILATSNGYLDW